MNYDATKYLGYLLDLTAKHMLSNEDVYQAAATLPRKSFEYIGILTDAIIEFYFAVLHEPDYAVHLADNYIMTEASKKFYPWKPAFDKKASFDFLDNNLGNVYSLLRGMSVDYGAICGLAHPELQDEGFISFAHEHFQELIRNSEKKDHPNMKKIFSFLKEKEDDVVSSSEQQKKKEELFEIKDNNQCVAVLDYLKRTGVLDDRTLLPLFTDSIAKADMSRIQPVLIDKFRMSVARMVSMIKNKPYKWQKLACASLGTTASRALGNVSKNSEWDDGLCEILPKMRKK